MRILLTASRDWDDEMTIRGAMHWAAGLARNAGTHPKLVHGACKTGGDPIAQILATRWGWSVERHPAPWDEFGKAAGQLRNAFMVGRGAGVCLAFIKNGSSGATGCAKLAHWAGIRTMRWMA